MPSRAHRESVRHVRLADPAAEAGRRFRRTRSFDPSLVRVPPDGEVGWFLNPLHQTDDTMNFVTGWGNDFVGVVGLGGFYAAWLPSLTFFAPFTHSSSSIEAALTAGCSHFVRCIVIVSIVDGALNTASGHPK